MYARILLIALLYISASCSVADKESKKPNILFLFIDDFTYRGIHALGNNDVISPVMDSLALNGTVFTHAYNMGGWEGAICTCSRSMLISGLTLWNANKHRALWHQQDAQARSNSWPQLMKAAGYNTYMTGKWHVDLPAISVFDEVLHQRPGMAGDHWRDNQLPALYKKYPQEEFDNPSYQAAFNAAMPQGYNRPLSPTDSSWLPYDSSQGGLWAGGKHWSEIVRDDAIHFINEAAASDKPGFFYIAFNAVHDPRQAPKAFLDLYPADKISLPANFLRDYPYHEAIGVGPRLRDEALAPFPRTEYAIREQLREYYALITHTDEQIGLILKKLKESGMDRNTIVILSSDQGLAVGSHGLMGKQNQYDHSIRVPLLISGPGIPKGEAIDEDVYLQDIMPTALELAATPIPSFVEFHSLLPLIKGHKSYLTGGVMGAYINYQRMIRKDGYKLIVYPNVHKRLLYDLRTDPQELHDLSGNPAYQATINKLFKELLQLQQQYKDDLDLSAISWN